MADPTTTTDADFERELAELRTLLSSRDEQIDALAKDSLAKEQEIERLRERIQLLLARIYGRRSEKLHPGQLSLFGDDATDGAPVAGASTPVDPAPDDEEEIEVGRTKKKRKSRATKLRDLPRERVEHDISAEEKICACCGHEKHRFDEAVTEEIDYVPASVIVREHVRPKYACRNCGDGVVIADLPPRLIDSGLPGPGLVAQIITAKYADHLPLHRQEAIFKRHGLELSRKTMCDWIGVAADVLLAIVLAMKRSLLQRPVLLSDDTHVMMQTNAKSKGCHRAFLWVWLPIEEDIVLYEFSLTRGQVVVEDFLKEFKGEILIADGYPGYNPCKERGVKRAGCWAHGRRYVKDGMASNPKEASEILVLIQMLYMIERQAKEEGLDAVARLELRQRKSKPILDQVRQAIDRMKTSVLPSSVFGEALTYLDNQWQHLVLFVEDGRVPIDNNASERGVRPVALGRKNWIFAGSLKGGQRAAIFYSLIETCRRLGIPPFDYLRDVLARISTHPHRLIHELTPAGWKAARAPATTVVPGAAN